MSRARVGSPVWGAGAIVVAVLVAACKPWTVRPLEQRSVAETRELTHADPADYVASIWEAKVVPEVVARAVELASIRTSRTSPINLLVKGTARVLEVDTRSRAGLAHLDLLPADGRVDAALQVGPVLRGTALRDALGLTLGDFVNQIAFATVATALNDRALRSALQGVAPSSLAGRTVSFAGAVRSGAAHEGRLEIVPVVLTIEERAR